MPRLGVNIDHIATLRQARVTTYPDPVDSLTILKKCHVDQVTVHLREDRRHIQDRDLIEIIKAQMIPVNMEMGVTLEMVQIALRLLPQTCTLVPEKREEITTEGGLDCIQHFALLKKQISQLHKKKIRVSLFIDPDLRQIEKAVELEVEAIELHTGTFCEQFVVNVGAIHELPLQKEFNRLQKAAHLAHSAGLQVFAGHGLNSENLPSVVKIREIEEYNIGHSLIARAVFVGLEKAIQEIQALLK